MKNEIKWNVAFSQIDITPDFPVEMIGCYREDNRPNGTRYPLCAQVLLFAYGDASDTYCCLIAIDSLGLTVELSDELRTNVAEVLNAPQSNVMLNFSHTHSAPNPQSSLNGQRYFALLKERVISCVKNAMEMLQPCLVGWTVGETEIAGNRRDGVILLIKRLGALQVINAVTKIPIVLLLRVCAHANVLMTNSDKLSSDYIGAAREKISKQFGYPIMFIQGAAGNLKPVGVDKINGGDLSDIDRISEILLRSALQLRFTPKDVTYLTMCEKEIELYSDIPTAAQATQIAAEAGMEASDWLRECARLRNED
jgi:hypothetical protein